MTPLRIKQVIHRGRFTDSVRLWLKTLLLRWLTKGSTPLFLRTGDIISFPSQAGGQHEPHVRALLDTMASNGYGGFLIDIGANVGLTSCQSADRFLNAYLFEPNPDVFRILEVNTSIALSKTRLRLFPFGLGPERRTDVLTIPKNNWGGAFVQHGNAYSDDVLAAKEGAATALAVEATHRNICLEPASETLAAIFDEMNELGLRSGVIKLDVEGFERDILKSLSMVVPQDMDVAVVFESWDAGWSPSNLCESFGTRAELFALVAHPPLNGAVWRRVLGMLAGGGRRFSLAPSAVDNLRGDMVLMVNAIQRSP